MVSFQVKLQKAGPKGLRRETFLLQEHRRRILHSGTEDRRYADLTMAEPTKPVLKMYSKNAASRDMTMTKSRVEDASMKIVKLGKKDAQQRDLPQAEKNFYRTDLLGVRE